MTSAEADNSPHQSSCKHDMVEVTTVRDSVRKFRCAKCRGEFGMIETGHPLPRPSRQQPNLGHSIAVNSPR
ncbi:MAG TPA: hypothetical protein VM265_08090 [Sphingomicrobium sp.]|nr:hypothetical protein [Sphingomicrobium sp.]